MDVSIEYNFRPFKQGTDWERSLEFKTSGVAKDLTGWVAKMTIRTEPHSGGVSILAIDSVTPTANGSTIVISAASGIITLKITDVDSDAFTWETAYYDLKMISPVADGSKEYVPIYGKLTVIPKVTP